MEYTVVHITGQLGRASTFTRDTSAALNEMAAQGWRLVAVDNFWAYLERATTQA